MPTFNSPDKFGFGVFSGTGVGTNAGVTVTQAAVAGRTPLVTGIQCSGDAAALVTVESPASTILYKKRMTGTGWTLSEGFPSPLVGTAGAAVLVKISASTSNSEANIQGYTV